MKSALASLAALLLGTGLLFAAVSCDSDDSNGGSGGTSQGGVVGFSTGEEASGPVPDDGTATGTPTIASIALANSQIKSPDALRVTLGFIDPEGDVTTVYFGVEGESSHYVLETDIASGQTNGNLTLDLVPAHYVPGYYQLVVSLGDATKNVSAAAHLDFVILNAEGTLPNPDAGTGGTGGGGTGGTGGSTGGTGGSTGGTGGGSTSPVFLVTHEGDGTTPPSTMALSLQGSTLQTEAVAKAVPMYRSSEYVDHKNGRIAFSVAQNDAPTDMSPIVMVDRGMPASEKFMPIPPKPGPDLHYSVPVMRPQVLSDGRVVVKVVWETDTPYDDVNEAQLALWTPSTDTFEFQGSLTGFVLSQPEIMNCNCDAEAGHVVGSAFAISPDEQWAYFSAASYGTETGAYHGGPALIGRWNLATKQVERVVFTDQTADVWAVSQDGTRLVVRLDGKFQSVDIAQKTITELASWGAPVTTGQVLPGAAFITSWRGCDPGAFGGIVRVSMTNASDQTGIVDGEKLTPPYRGLNNNSVVSHDGSSIYFAASTDVCTNYASPWVIMKVPVGGGTPEQVGGEVDGTYWSSTFMLL